MRLKGKITMAAVSFGLLLFNNNTVQAQAPVKKELLIKGKVAVLNPDMFKKYNMVWLYKGIGKGKKIVDSVPVNADGSFTLRIKSGTAALYQLDLLKWQSASFWSDQDVNITARGYDTARVKSKNSGFVSVESKSKATQLINAAIYNNYLAEQEMSLLTDESYAAMRHASKDSTWLKYLRADGLIKSKSANETLRLKQMITANEDNPASVYLLGMLSTDKDNAFFETTVDKLITRYPQMAEAKQLKQEYLEKRAIRNSLKMGSPIPGIVYNDPNGKPVDIKSFKGKYVLIDFWASWCGPCRKAIPEIKTLYSQYKEKGFEVLSVSVDTDNAAWRRAMTEEAMPWTQVLSPDKNKTLADFMIIGIPTLYLVDRDGKIVEKYTGFSQKLKTQLGEIFKD
ncbi:TlpA family protein disulfide reductase [Pedobacter sp. MC2016-14]|uniref:TlpA family protein disulfide reductase n=1 Tax=Pedobacter sp. MC2016-14 TaxID=2897327 RepID=UPI001E40BD1D|nr:TlpA disulfide reductase family protein [Pedobacter sp. MC2016-14]MCD0490412.1 TlpA family protein disulfide reductase [Pedobacter sp. MC2016-14]